MKVVNFLKSTHSTESLAEKGEFLKFNSDNSIAFGLMSKA